MTEPVNILIVDDSKVFADSLHSFFQAHGLTALAVNKSNQVMETVEQFRPQVILLGSTISGIDGVGLCKMIKERYDWHTIIIAVFPTRVRESDREKAYQAGAEASMAKDVPLEEIGQQVLRILREKITITFWGTRGSIPTPGPHTVKYGGNTSCVEVRLGSDDIIIFDAGSGIRELGDHLVKANKRVKGHIFLTHFHWDHIQGLPFFAPAFSAENQFMIYGYENKEVKIGKLLADQMESIYFPVPLRRFGARIQFHPLDEGMYRFEAFDLRTIYLNHPSNTLGYLVTHRNKTIGYLTDNEFISNITAKPPRGRTSAADEFNLKIIDAVRCADLIIIDAQYTKKEYQQKRGWGHSHYEHVLDVMTASDIKRLALFHHDPSHSDRDIDDIVRHSRQIIKERGRRIECFGAQEGLQVQL